tara:strand:+ start:832 stop:2118 length:1287 start_codon:yes stop_codon:yes gene_type:complete
MNNKFNNDLNNGDDNGDTNISNSDNLNTIGNEQDNNKEQTNNYKTIDSFEDLEIDQDIIRGVFSYGFERPSKIQSKAILPVIDGRDVIAQAQSGTGKTATFCIGTLSRIEKEINAIQALVLVHTREMALQINNVFNQIGKYMNIKISICIKGVNIRDNINDLLGKNKENLVPKIVIGTPGRVIDMMNKSALKTDKLKIVVMDEADELLSEGFIEQIKNIVKSIPKTTQLALFSATMNNDFFEITKKFMNEPLHILVKNDELTLEGIRQFYIDIQKNEYKYETLCDLYGVLIINQSIIYCNSQRIVENLSRRMTQNNFTVSFMHGNMTPLERENTMSDFRNGKNKVLITTDLLGRGIDIQQISVVINYDVPSKIENYIHRIGRSGRYGRKGVAINFMTNYDRNRIQNIEKYYSTYVEEMPANINDLINQ